MEVQSSRLCSLSFYFNTDRFGVLLSLRIATLEFGNHYTGKVKGITSATTTN